MNKFKYTLGLLMALAVAAPEVSSQETFKRGLEQVSFIPKGQWLTGISVNYAHSSQDNYQFLIIEDVSGDAYSFKVSPMLQYCFKDNLTAGGKFAYERTQTTIDRASVKIDSETTYDTNNFMLQSDNYYGAAVFRNYISLGSSMRFAFFNQVQLEIGGGRSKLLNGEGDDLTGTFQKQYSVNVGLTPGMMMFLNNYSAIEVNVGVLGFEYNHTKATTDHVYVATTNRKKANFKVNLFSISFGVAFYL